MLDSDRLTWWSLAGWVWVAAGPGACSHYVRQYFSSLLLLSPPPLSLPITVSFGLLHSRHFHAC